MPKLRILPTLLLSLSLLFVAGTALAADEALPTVDEAATFWSDDAAATPAEAPEGADSIFYASCTSMYCGNTGTKYGYGNSCSAAKTDLDSVLSAAAYSLCPGVVTGIDRNYGGCSGGSPIAECKYSGNADIYCKICPGQSCFLEW
ncbi:MAG: hypothetical protein AAGC60_19940 [Acidobacteriota bacterium]